jgi:hypothetical protein
MSGFSSSKASTIVWRFSSLPSFEMKLVYVIVTGPESAAGVAQPVMARAAMPSMPTVASSLRFMVLYLLRYSSVVLFGLTGSLDP